MRFKSITSAIAALGLILGGTVYLEGMENHAYLDSGGVPTICSGITAGVKLGDTYSDATCIKMTQLEVNEYTAFVRSRVKVPIKPHTEAALVWFAFNVGKTGFDKSLVLRELNKGNYAGSCYAYVRTGTDGKVYGYVNVKGKLNKGLINRRKVEQEYCRHDLTN